MNNAFFSRVELTTSYSTLVAKAKKQITAGHKPLSYDVIAKVYLPEKEFDAVINNISLPISQYKEYYKDSITSPDGIWQCIEVKCPLDTRTIIVYTAGRTFPLYAAPRFHKNRL